MTFSISAEFIASQNEMAVAAHKEDYAALSRQLDRRGIDIEAMTARAMAYAVDVPTWGVGTGGTRFARFPGPGEPRGIHEKLEDCGVINQLARINIEDVAGGFCRMMRGEEIDSFCDIFWQYRELQH